MNPRVGAAVVDVFVYVVVLNVFVEYFPKVLSESFTLSLLTAILLKAALEFVVALKKRLRSRFSRASSATEKVVVALAIWLLLVASKFVVLETVDIVFGDKVSLGGFVSVTLLIVVLLVARGAVRRVVRVADPCPPLTRSE